MLFISLGFLFRILVIIVFIGFSFIGLFFVISSFIGPKSKQGFVFYIYDATMGVFGQIIEEIF